MASLSDSLLELLVISTTFVVEGSWAASDNDLKSNYRATIEEHRVTLDSLFDPTATITAQARAQLVCAASKLLFGSAVVDAEDSTYDNSQQKNWSSTCWLPAACFIRIINPHQLCIVLKILTHVQATFAVRSGGHNANVGYGSVGKEGVVLDLSALNEIIVFEEEGVVSVGPGATWEAVYTELEKHRLTVAGGRVSDVGVGGLILGGGMSHFTTRWGSVADNLINVELVTADSKIVIASAGENDDLFRALKGGGANFGIVTTFNIYTNPDYQVWYTFKVYNGNDAAKILDATVRVQEAMEEDDRIGFFLTDNGGMFIAGMVYLGWSDSQPAAFDAFNDIMPVAVAVPPTNGTMLSVAKAANVPGSAKHAVGGISICTDSSLYQQINDVYQDILKDQKVSADFSLAFTFQPVAARASKASIKMGGNPMHISPVSQAWLAFSVQWTEDSEDKFAIEQIQKLISSARDVSRAAGKLLDFEFMNDAGFSQSPLKSYGARSLAELNAVRLTWDPKEVFQKLQNSGFLLSKI